MFRLCILAITLLVASIAFAIPVSAAQTTTTIATVPVSNHGSGTITTAARSVPINFDSAEVDINCTTGNQAAPFTGFTHSFSDPSEQITFGIEWSWDGGSTFPASTQGTQSGNINGIWGINRQGNPVMTPVVVLGIPYDSNLGGAPGTYRAYMTVVSGPITFGLTVLETTG